MYKFLFLFLFLFSQAVFSNNPHIYASLGDTLYNNEQTILNLKKIDVFNKYFSDKINKYITKLKQTKQIGFAIESGVSKVKPKEYLAKLRELSKTYDFFIRSVNKMFYDSMRRHDYDLFLKLVNSDLLDLKRKKDEILRFYYANKAIITPTRNLSKLIEEDKLQKKSKRDKNYWIRLKKKKEEEKIKRLRKKDKKRQEEIQKKLEEELLRKKEAIRKEQLKELQNTY